MPTKIPKIIVSEMLSSFLNDLGQEVNNPTPMFHHTDLNRPLTLDERVDRMLATKLSKLNKESGGESLEEACDFDIDDVFENEPKGPYEYEPMQEEFLQGEEPDASAPSTPETKTEETQAGRDIPPKQTADATQIQLPLEEAQPKPPMG